MDARVSSCCLLLVLAAVGCAPSEPAPAPMAGEQQAASPKSSDATREQPAKHTLSDAETAASLRHADTGRHLHLWQIAIRLDAEGRLRDGSSPERAADVAFAETTPAGYEELVRQRGWPVDAAAEALADAVVAAIIEPGTRPVLDPAPDWSGAAAMLPGAPS